MGVIQCPNLCEGCPIREGFEGSEPELMTELGYTASGTISGDRKSVSFELEDGMPVGERTSTIGILNSDGVTGYTFEALGSEWDKGKVEKALEDCEAPHEITYGFLHLRRKMGCTALDNI